MAGHERMGLFRFWICMGVILGVLKTGGSKSQAYAQDCPRFKRLLVETPTKSSLDCCGDGVPCNSLEAAIRSSDDGAVITLGPGLHQRVGSGPIDLGSTSVSIIGWQSRSSSVFFDCQGGPCLAVRCPGQQAGKKCPAVSIQLDSFTLRNGRATASGGCFSAMGVAVGMKGMKFFNCQAAASGGSIFISDATNATLSDLTLSNSLVDATAPDAKLTGGGAIAVVSSNIFMDGVFVFNSSAAAPGVGGGIAAAESKVMLKGLVVSDCSAENGGGMSVSASAMVMEDSMFKSCMAGSGGGLYVGSSPSVSISNCSFESSQASMAMSPQFFSQGGCAFISSASSVQISDTTFASCSSDTMYGGLAVSSSGPVTLLRSSFRRNSAASQGGGLGLESCASALLQRSTFESNFISVPFAFAGGAAIIGTNATVKGCTFFNNSAFPGFVGDSGQGQGGAVMIQGFGDYMEGRFEDSIFEENSGDKGGAFFGLAGVFFLHNCSFVRNGQYATRGGAIWTASITTITYSLFANNSAYVNGGALYSDASRPGPLTVAGSSFEGNVASTDGGGAIFSDMGSAELSISSCRFSQNSAPTAAGGGVAFHGSLVNFADSQFEENYAGIKGGAIYAAVSSLQSDAASLASLSRCSFARNNARLGGGALFAERDSVLTLVNSSFVENNSTTGGAMLLLELTDVAISGGECASNVASMGGGCFAAGGNANVRISSVEIASNKGTSEGGGVRLTDSARLWMDKCSFRSNSASFGAVVWAEMESELVARNSTFEQNAAQFEGGGIYATHEANLTLSKCTFSSNSALRGAALVTDSLSTLSSSSCGFFQNRGNAITVQGRSIVDISDANFDGNRAMTANGGALRITEDATATLTATTFERNVALLGGGVYSEGSPKILFDRLEFAENDAQSGAAAAFAGSSVFSGGFSLFRRNNASVAGGGIAIFEQSQGSLWDSDFVDNFAVIGGAGVFVKRLDSDDVKLNSSSLLLRKLSFDGNRALYDQGGAFLESSFDPEIRTTCQACWVGSDRRSIGTLPASFGFRWPGSPSASPASSDGTFAVHAAVDSAVTGLQVVVLDALGTPITQDNSSIAFVLPDDRISGLLRATAVNGIVTLPPIGIDVTPDTAKSFNLTVTLVSSTDAFPDISGSFNITFCPAGSYYNNATYQCETCSVGSWCAAGQPMTPCPDGTFSFYPGAANETTDCLACEDENLDCSNGKLQVAYQAWLDPLTLNSTPTTYQCLVTNGCNGYEYFGPETNQCLPGYRNDVLMCSLCESNHFFLLQYCDQCTKVFKDIFPLLLILVIIAWILMNVLTDTFRGIDIFLQEVQLLVMVASFNVNFPAAWVRRLVQLYNLAVLDPDVIGPECVFQYQFPAKFFVGLAIPLIGLAVYGLLYLKHRYFPSTFAHVHSFFFRTSAKPASLQRSVTRRRASNDYEDSLLHAALNWLDLNYVSVMVRVLFVFSWQLVGDQKVMVAAPQIEWLSSTHVAMLVVAIFVTIVYLAGLPAAYAYVLFNAQKKGTLNSTEFKSKFGFLTERFTRQFFWWHLVNVGLKIVHGAILAFGITSANVQVVLILAIQVLRIASQYKSSPLSSRSLEYLQSSLTLGQFFFTLGLICYNYIDLNIFSQCVFAISTVLMLAPAFISFCYEASNKHVEIDNDRLLRKLWKIEKKRKADKFRRLNPYDIVEPHEICAWFRPHVLFALLLTKRVRERRLLLRVRDRFETCQLAGLAPVDWLNHLKKPQLYAVLSQALLGASAGHITVARVPRKGVFCKEHGTWHMAQDECVATRVDPTPKPAAAWPPRLERHVSWASHSGSGDFEKIAAQVVKEVDEERAREQRLESERVEVVVAGTAAESADSGNVSPLLGDDSSASSASPERPAAAAPAAASGAAAGAAASVADRRRLMRPPSIRVQNLVQWDRQVDGGLGGEGAIPEEAEGQEEPEFVEAKMNMAELTLTLQKHLSMLVQSEKKKQHDSLRLVLRSEYIPTILSWLTSAESNQNDQRLLRELILAARDAAMEEFGGLGWLQGVGCFYRNQLTRIKYNEALEASAPDPSNGS